MLNPQDSAIAAVAVATALAAQAATDTNDLAASPALIRRMRPWLLTGEDSDPGCVTWKDREGGVEELLVNEEGLEEH